MTRLKILKQLIFFLFLNSIWVKCEGQDVSGGGIPDADEYRRFQEYIASQKKGSVKLEGFENCDITECNRICGTNETEKSYCEADNNKLCMCSTEKFMSANVHGLIIPVNRANIMERNCSVACNIRNSYARIWHRSDYTKTCNCLKDQITRTGMTLCDEFALQDWCKATCKSESARCAFNGICLCRGAWKPIFHMEVPAIRKEVHTDGKECSKRCREYNTEYAARLYDPKEGIGPNEYKFREKFCMCGEELEAEDAKMAAKLHSQGFQQCTGLKCKQRCGMNMEAECEPKYRRACLCPRFNIFIGNFLWVRLPSKKEGLCVEACLNNGLAPRVIEWNPLFNPQGDWTNGVYRESTFAYLYDGKFCHCINLKREIDVNQFRPCTNELCRWICGHQGATCDMKTRRYCLCNTHQMVGGLGRRPDPGEVNCNIMCRRNLFDARIIDVVWDIPAPHWSVQKAKFCGCVRPVTPAGLTHCEGIEGRDNCPKMCNTTTAYCTRDKVCECQVKTDPLGNGLIRVPNGKEADECGEVCRSWTWPITEDSNNQPYIYDESRATCIGNNSCPETDVTPWKLGAPGSLKVHFDALEQSGGNNRRYCLCIRTETVFNKPGIRLPFQLEPARLTKHLPCILNYTCIAVSESLHVVA